MTKTMNQFSFAGAMQLILTNVMSLNATSLNATSLSVMSLNVMQLNVMNVMLQAGVMTYDGTRSMGFLPLMSVLFDSELACAVSRAISNR